MFIYFRTMRIKDEHKQEAIVQATIELVNEIGFASSSVAKIAKKANVSPATIYIYYKNKEDLLVSTYVDIKVVLGNVIVENISFAQPIRDILSEVWHKTIKYMSENKSVLQYTEQFSNSPYSDLVDHKKLEKAFEPIVAVIQKGIEQKIIKNVSSDILFAFIFFPMFIISNPKHCKNIELDRDTIETAFTLAWDAIKF